MLRFLLKFLFFIPYRLIFWVKVINKKELKKLKGKPFVLVCNHRNGLDGPTVFMTVLTRKLHFWVKEEFFKSAFWRFIWRGLGGIPVNANSALSLIRNSQKVLRQNRVLVIAPTGHRSFNGGNELKVQNGAAMVALRAGVPLVPFMTDRPIKPFRLTRIKVGDMIPADGGTGRQNVDNLTNRIGESMVSLLVNFEKLPKQKKWQKEPSSIVRGIIVHNEKILVLKRNKSGEEYYVFPGGHIEEGETAAEACKREVFEETGIEVTPFREIYKYFYVDKDKKYTRGNGGQTFFVCEYKSGEPHKTSAEEYTEIDRGQGTYEPMWLPIQTKRRVGRAEREQTQDLETAVLKPLCIKQQLMKDYAKKGARLSYPLRLIKGKK